MADRTYKVTEVYGTSSDGLEQAIRNGIKRASETVRHLAWFEVTEIRGFLGERPPGDVDYFQVGLKIGFRLEDE